MSHGYLLQVFNKTGFEIKLKVTLKSPGDWDNPKADNPKDMDGLVLKQQTNSQKYHGEVANGPSSAPFTLEFDVQGVGSVIVTADPYEVVHGHSYKRSLTVSGTAADKFQVLQAEYDAANGDNWRNMALAICPKIDATNWMSRLNPSLALHDITLPGTHDSGTAVKGLYALSVTQTLSIKQQLEQGIRFLDIRLNKDNKFEICHGASNTGLFFEADCVEVIADFLATQGKKETILLCVKSEKGTTDWFHDGILDILTRTMTKKFGSDASKHLFTGKKPGNLGSLRGAVVLVRRYWIDNSKNVHKAHDANSGWALEDPQKNPGVWFTAANHVGTTYQWPNNSDTFNDIGSESYAMVQHPDNFGCVIQDWFDLQTSYYSSKVTLVEKYLDAAFSGLKDAWFLNFTSCGTSAREGNPDDFAKGDTELNASLFRYLIANPRGRYGTIIMDFPEFPAGLINLIISTNENLLAPPAP